MACVRPGIAFRCFLLECKQVTMHYCMHCVPLWMSNDHSWIMSSSRERFVSAANYGRRTTKEVPCLVGRTRSPRLCRAVRIKTMQICGTPRTHVAGTCAGWFMRTHITAGRPAVLESKRKVSCMARDTRFYYDDHHHHRHDGNMCAACSSTRFMLQRAAMRRWSEVHIYCVHINTHIQCMYAPAIFVRAEQSFVSRWKPVFGDCDSTTQRAHQRAMPAMRTVAPILAAASFTFSELALSDLCGALLTTVFAIMMVSR